MRAALVAIVSLASLAIGSSALAHTTVTRDVSLGDGVAAGLVAVAAPAQTGPHAPNLIHAGHDKLYPVARWTLPPNVRAELVEVAKSPETTADGSFVFANLVGGDALRPTDTTWLAGVPVPLGTYYVHVRGYDSSCTTSSGGSPCGAAWSNVLSFSTPPNTAPRITGVKIAPSRGWRMTAFVSLCDEDHLGPRFSVTESLTRVRPHVTVRKTVHAELHFAGCDTVEVAWRLSSRIRRSIRYGHRLTITLRYRDSGGLMSRPVSRSWDIRD